MKEKYALYLVATPIGNLKDITLRAIETLKMVDFIAAEDTRNSLKLLNHYEIKKPLVSYYEHNKRERGGDIIARLQNGETCALITDAGMPAISDPGGDLVALCIENGVSYTIIPGACAAVSALALSGLPTGRFCFEGFLSTSKKSRFEHLNGLKDETRTIIFYEAPHKLRQTLKDLLSYLGDRKISLVREITKIYEEVLPITISQAIALYEGKEPKGEFVLVIDGKKEEVAEKISQEQVQALFDNLVKKGTSKSRAIKELSLSTGINKNELYAFLIKST